VEPLPRASVVAQARAATAAVRSRPPNAAAKVPEARRRIDAALDLMDHVVAQKVLGTAGWIDAVRKILHDGSAAKSIRVQTRFRDFS
jgi:hypothetical protein